jgi:hypothetical protein
MSYIFHHKDQKFWAKELKDRVEVNLVRKGFLGQLKVVVHFRSSPSLNERKRVENVNYQVMDHRPSQDELIALLDSLGK